MHFLYEPFTLLTALEEWRLYLLSPWTKSNGMTIKLKLFAYTLAHYYLCFSHLDKTINLYLRSRSAQLIFGDSDRNFPCNPTKRAPSSLTCCHLQVFERPLLCTPSSQQGWHKPLLRHVAWENWRLVDVTKPLLAKDGAGAGEAVATTHYMVQSSQPSLWILERKDLI